QDNVGIVRNEPEMAKAVVEIARLRQRAAGAGIRGHREYNPGWHTAIDLPNLLMVSEAVARSGLDRQESRGAHFREDFPAKDEGHSKHNTVVSMAEDGSMRLRREPI